MVQIRKHYSPTFKAQVVQEVLAGDKSLGQIAAHVVQRSQDGTDRALDNIETIYTPSKLFTSTNLSNEPMQRLCERLGYVRSGIIEHLDEDDPELFYFKHLFNDEPFRKAETL